MDITSIIKELEKLSIDERIEAINNIRRQIHDVSPLKNNPIDLVLWEKTDNVVANDYNPNEVAPPEMELLEISIINDGYTQPIVGWKHEGEVTIIDGFHRHRVGRESKIVSKGLMGYLPIVDIRKEQQGKNDRIASTIRHNRARGKHKVDAMSEIVIELKNRNWKNERIARELGMDEEEVLRLLQISGLQEMFKDDDFSKSWDADGNLEDFVPITDDISEEEILETRTVNVDDPDRVFHTYDKRECHKAGLYKTSIDGKTADQCEKEFSEFFIQDGLFLDVGDKVISERKNSCEHYLTNKCMNRIAWMGQACVCYHTSIPGKYSGGWFLLDKETQDRADQEALDTINKRMVNNNRPVLTMVEAKGGVDRQVSIY